MSKHWTPLWEMILDSTLWSEELHVRVMFLTFLAKKDCDGLVYSTVIGMSRAANMSFEQAKEAIKILESPDKKSVKEQEFEGRRIKATEDGWMVLSHYKYRDMVSKEMAKERNRRHQEAFRKRQKDKLAGKIPKSQMLPGEAAYLKASKEGASQEELDRLSEPAKTYADKTGTYLGPVEEEAFPPEPAQSGGNPFHVEQAEPPRESVGSMPSLDQYRKDQAKYEDPMRQKWNGELPINPGELESHQSMTKAVYPPVPFTADQWEAQAKKEEELNAFLIKPSSPEVKAILKKADEEMAPGSPPAPLQVEGTGDEDEPVTGGGE